MPANTTNPPGRIILLNGASSAGKSSIAKQLQQQFLPHPLLNLGIDEFMHFLPQEFFAIEPEAGYVAHQGLRWILPLLPDQKRKVRDAVYQNAQNHLAKYEKFLHALKEFGFYDTVTQKGVQIACGPAIRRIITGLHGSVAALSLAGNDLVLEHAFLEKHWRDDCIRALAHLPVILVGVHCPIEILEKRELERGYRIAGQTRGHYEHVHSEMQYDIELDTSTMTPQACAEQIMTFVKNENRPQALSGLSDKLSK